MYIHAWVSCFTDVGYSSFMRLGLQLTNIYYLSSINLQIIFSINRLVYKTSGNGDKMQEDVNNCFIYLNNNNVKYNLLECLL